MHSFQYDWHIYWHCNGARYRFHQPDFPGLTDASANVEHRISNQVVEAQDQLGP